MGESSWIRGRSRERENTAATSLTAPQARRHLVLTSFPQNPHMPGKPGDRVWALMPTGQMEGHLCPMT